MDDVLASPPTTPIADDTRNVFGACCLINRARIRIIRAVGCCLSFIFIALNLLEKARRWAAWRRSKMNFAPQSGPRPARTRPVRPLPGALVSFDTVREASATRASAKRLDDECSGR